MEYNLENFRDLSLDIRFSITCFSETWTENDCFDRNFLYQLKSYNVIQQTRNGSKRGRLCVLVHESLL